MFTSGKQLEFLLRRNAYCLGQEQATIHPQQWPAIGHKHVITTTQVRDGVKKSRKFWT